MRVRWYCAIATVTILVTSGAVASMQTRYGRAHINSAQSSTVVIKSTATTRDGRTVSAVNHLRRSVSGKSTPALASASDAGQDATQTTEYLVVWAGDWNAADAPTADATSAFPRAADATPGPDFLAVIGANGADKGVVVNTVTVEGVENEPHHMQYVWNVGDRIYAGALFTDKTFVFAVNEPGHPLPEVTLIGVNEAMDTPCGSVPDAYWVMSDGTAYGTYMGGPNVAGDPRCNGGISNGYAGTPGELVHIGTDGRTLGEFGADGGLAFANDSQRPTQCASNPALARPSCANPHGIQVREDLGVIVSSDYAEPRNVPTDPVKPVNPNLFRDTVRTWEFARTATGFDFNAPKLRSVSAMPLGAMAALPPQQVDQRGFMGIMEVTLSHPVTNSRGHVHRGAFASSMCGGAVYYTGDITALHPMWRQVFEATAAAKAIGYPNLRRAGCAGAGWIQTSPDDHVLFHAVIGRNPGTFAPDDPGLPKMVYALDVSQLVDIDAADWVPENPAICTITEEQEAFDGGVQASCPRIASPGANVLRLGDATSGGPHWGAIDNFSLASLDGRLTTVTRIATSDYFVARAGVDGDHKVCIVDVDAVGALTLDTGFRDEYTGSTCVDFNRTRWHHGNFGAAKPHSMLFVVAPS